MLRSAEWSGPSLLLPLAAGVLAATLPFLSLPLALVLLGVGLGIPLVWWMFSRNQWLIWFLGSLVLLPPFPFPIGDSGAHPAIALIAVGLLACAVRLDQWSFRLDAVATAGSLLLFAMVLSLASAGIHSGAKIAAASLARIVLFSFGLFVYLGATIGSDRIGRSRRKQWTQLLFTFASIAALFACFDFAYQLPTPAGFEPQFLWLESGVYRRAQGLFYEASTLGNFCGFFLTFVAVSLYQSPESRPIASKWLLPAALVFGTAMLLSFSRASVIACTISLATVVVLCTKHWQSWRILLAISGAILLVSAAFVLLAPEVAEGYWSRVALAVDTIRDSPDRALSGRLSSWETVLAFIAEHPAQSLVGIGYKTLPYTEHLGRPVIADNMYLATLVETGMLGLAALVLLNFAILRVAWRSMRAGSLYGTWMFCFWIGESLQMLSGDILTYWRVLPVYFWVLAQAHQEAAECAS